MHEIVRNQSPIVDRVLRKRPILDQNPLDVQNKKIKKVVDKSCWTLEESNALKSIMQRRCSSGERNQWTAVRQSLKNKGIFKSTKQINARWRNSDHPKVLSKIVPEHKGGILWLVSHFNNKWAKISNFLKDHNNGFFYSENALKNFYNASCKPKKHEEDRREAECLIRQYPGLSEDVIAVRIAKSFHLDELKIDLPPDNSLISEEHTLQIPFEQEPYDYMRDSYDEAAKSYIEASASVEEFSDGPWDLFLEDLEDDIFNYT